MALVFGAALVAGASYCLDAWRIVDPGAWGAVWKTSGVALLALWTASRARSPDGWLLAGALALGALGDLLLETHGLIVGGALFAAGHLVACLLYLRNRRDALTPSQQAVGWLLAPATIGIAALFAAPAGGAIQAGVYSAFLGVMAALAWTSRFPRYRVGLGAVLFVVSDLLIFSRFGPLKGSFIPTLLIWPTYFAAQALIAWGVSRALGKDDAARSAL
ncbi:lysoplasmalogenase family protein [Sphingomonas sp.]|uniref:lysoplasmalogenase family protein n=1 Tax=Sphingomonas sp. TaxID=28214 RepID=UPI001EBC8C40|nr:lysoplasmalogenase family protein [Sphingomonas sp.]MBX3594074.1 lysoplasmalogenase [Sphingomonas sp.]